MDNEGQVVTSSNGDTLSLSLESKSPLYVSKYDAGNNLRSERGVFNLTDVTFVGEPGTDAVLSISSSSIDGSL